MARTSGTRPKGNGPGKGFVLKPPRGGKPQPFTADSPTRVSDAAERNTDPETKEYRGEQIRLSRERRRNAWAALDAMVKKSKHPSHFNATRETLNRVEGMPVQKTEITGAGGGPLQSVGIVTDDPVEAARMYQQIMGDRG
jgi:hypothetical protein